MRQVVLDTETTGLEVSDGHRVIEIGAVELVDRRANGNSYHTYLNPDRTIDEGARKVTGISDAFLLDQPHFADVVEDFLAFIQGSELIIHNAPFDIGFLNAELALAGSKFGQMGDHASVLDTLVMARDRYPGQRNSLDALCKRLGVDNTRRDLHGGLLDAQLLAEVYLAMTSGQSDLGLSFMAAGGDQVSGVHGYRASLTERPLVLRATQDELAAHAARLDALDTAVGGESLWRRLQSAAGEDQRS